MASAFWLLLAGAGIADGKASVLQPKSYSIKQNGNYAFTPDAGYDGFSSVNVSVNVETKLQEKSVTPTKQEQTIVPDTGYDGLSKLVVGAIPASYIDTSSANATSPDILAPKTAFVKGELVTGTMQEYNGEVSSGGYVPTLYSPTIALSKTGILTVTDNQNGAFASKYYLIVNDVQTTEIVNKTIDLTTVFVDYAVGTYNVKVRVTSPNNAIRGADSNVVTYGVYSIGYSLTHVTASTAPTRIQQGMNATIMLAADTDWFLPADVSVSNASIVEYDVTTGKLIIGSAKGNVSVTVVGSDVEPIVGKGKIITIEGKQYRVLKVAGNVVEVLAMYDASTSQVFNATSKTVAFTGGATGQQYQGSDLDTYLNETFFATLSATMQAAIVPKAINQDMWNYSSGAPSSGTYYHQTYGTSNRYYYDNASGTSYGTAEVGSRNVYALSVKDVIDYLGVSVGGDFADTDIWQMFWNVSTAPGSYYPWLRSAYRSRSITAFCVGGYGGTLGYDDYNYSDRARPAFQIDLSKVEFTS